MEELARLPAEVRARWLAEQPVEILEQMARREWWWIGRPEQHPPAGKWFVWLIRSGRGWGKTQTGAEWIADRAITHSVDVFGRPTEHLLIAETLNDALLQCIGGPAGLRRVLERRLGPEQHNQHDATGKWKLWKAPKPVVVMRETGAKIIIEGADDEDVGRGFNAASAWLDEYAKWKKPDGSWAEGIMPSLRADLPGDFPRCLVTTTPKLVVQLVEWMQRADGSVYVTAGSTYDNATNLAAPAIAELHRRYSGTRLGRQELLGELLMEAEGALWTLDMIEPHRVDVTPELTNVVVGMDPPGADDPTSDECGLIAVGRGVDGRDYVLGDWSKRIVGHAAARRAWEMVLLYGASVLVYEDNMGKHWLRGVLVQAYREMQGEGLFPPGGNPPLKSVTAKIRKRLRAEPVAARYEQGKVSHVRNQNLGDLETQMVNWVPEETPKSPDRIDAMVYAELHLTDREHVRAGVASPTADLPGRTTLGPLAGTGMSGGAYGTGPGG
jgi:phage terminase large subunit-like protein